MSIVIMCASLSLCSICFVFLLLLLYEYRKRIKRSQLPWNHLITDWEVLLIGTLIIGITVSLAVIWAINHNSNHLN